LIARTFERELGIGFFNTVPPPYPPNPNPYPVGIFFDFSQWRQPLTCIAWRALGTENPGVLPKKTADIPVFLLWPRERSPG
jgi:hypothetical protein